MHSTEISSGTAGLPRRTVAALIALVVALAAAFVGAPDTLAAIGPGDGYADQDALTGAVRGAFVEYWRAGDAHLTPAMQSVTDYWLRYHLAKAVIAALLLGVLVALGVRLWQAYARADRHRAVLAAGGTLVTVLALAAVTLVMANVQGVVAPFASLLPMLVDTPPDAALADTLGQVRQQLDGSVRGGGTTPALDAMIDAFAVYHWAMAVIASVAVAVFIGVSVALWRRFAASSARRMLGPAATLSALVALVFAVVVAANIGTAADPAPAFLALFEGGW